LDLGGLHCFAWAADNGARHVVAVTYADNQGQRRLPLPFPKFLSKPVRLTDVMGTEVYDRDISELIDSDPYIDSVRVAGDRRIIMPRRLAAAVLTSLVAACTSIGPGTVPHDRIDYASSIGDSWKEQTLLNIVKLRYADMPIFLEVAQVIAGYQLQSALSGSFTLGNFTASLIDRLTATGGATAASTYTDRPTVVYSPLTGVDFLKG
jgi:hypothetical protein